MSDDNVNNADAAPQNQDAQLGVADIKNAVQCLDYAAQQGAFRGWDVITQVLVIRNKLKAFVDAVESQSVTDGDTASEGPVDTSDESTDTTSDAPTTAAKVKSKKKK